MSYLIVGNFFSLLSVLALGWAASRKNKKDFMFWNIWDTVFGTLANFVLSAYAALIICILGLIRNYLSYRGTLTQNITYVLLVLSIIIGAYINNLGIIGWLPIIAAGGYTLGIYWTRNEQQLRWVLLINFVLWFIHNVYIQAYPALIGNIALSFWTAFQIYKNRR